MGSPGPVSKALDVMDEVNGGVVDDTVGLAIEAGLQQLHTAGAWDAIEKTIDEVLKRPRYTWLPQRGRALRTFRLSRVNPGLAEQVERTGAGGDEPG